MTVQEVKSIIYEFAQSQGFYGRLARDLNESNGWGRLAKAATRAKCTTELDLVRFLEEG